MMSCSNMRQKLMCERFKTSFLKSRIMGVIIRLFIIVIIRTTLI